MIRIAAAAAATQGSSAILRPRAVRSLWVAAAAAVGSTAARRGSPSPVLGVGAWSQQQARGMAGHSKWAKIKRAKAGNDRARAVLFTKLTVELMEAARLAKGDTTDIRLAAAISKAKASNMPKENIDGAVKRGVEGKAGANMEAVQYEGIGPGSTAIIVEALTDNRKRTAPSVRHIFSKNGGALGTTGSVAWMFDRRGLLEVSLEGKGPEAGEELLEAALEAGAEDVEEEEEEEEGAGAEGEAEEEKEERLARVYCDPSELAAVCKGLGERGWQPGLVQFSYVPKSYVDVSETKEGEGPQLLALLEALEEDPDVQNVFHNARLV